MRVDIAMMVGVVFFMLMLRFAMLVFMPCMAELAGNLDWDYAARSGDELSLKSRGVLEALHPAFEAEAVDDKDVGAGERLRIGRGRTVNMRVAIRADEGRDLHAVAAHLLHHVSEDAEGGDRLHPCLGMPLQRSGRDQRHRQEELRDDARDHGTTFLCAVQASRCLRGRSRQSTPPFGPASTDST
jgi:hypothetical protein